MALTKISGNQIATSTLATVDSLTFLDGESVLRLPTGTELQRPGTPAVGTLRYNTDGDTAEVYKADNGTGVPGWLEVGAGGATLGKKGIIRSNADYIDEDIEIDPSLGDEYTNAFTKGPVEIRNGSTVEVAADANWEIWGGEPDDPRPGTVLQYFHAQTPATRQTIATDNLSDVAARINGLSISITPTRSTSKIVMIAQISHTHSHVMSFGFQKDGAILQTGLNNGSNNLNTPYAVKTIYDGGGNTDEYILNTTYSYEISSSDFTPGVEMTIQACGTSSWSNGVRTFYINDRNSGGGNGVQDMRSISTMTVMEIMG